MKNTVFVSILFVSNKLVKNATDMQARNLIRTDWDLHCKAIDG